MPPEALARQARLAQLLETMEWAGPSLEPVCLKELRTALAGVSQLVVEDWLPRLQALHLVEEAAELLRSSHRRIQDTGLQKRLLALLTPLAAQAQAKRVLRHHLDSKRTTIRFGFSKQAPVLELEDRDLQTLFLRAFRLEGLNIALDLGKHPRPLLHSPLPLSAGAAGLDESMEVELNREPLDSGEELLKRFQVRLPPGLKIHRWEPISNHASGLAELAVASHWRWVYPSSMAGLAQEWAEAFKPSTEGGEGFLRTLVWEEGSLVFSTAAGSFAATNPMKVLATKLGLRPGEVTGVTRVRVDLRPDSKLAQGDRYEAKLKNLYEDAVLLGGGSNITVVDEDDDEPLRLG